MMPTPIKHKTVQARILKCAKAIYWTVLSHKGMLVLPRVDVRHNRDQF